jgi:hypothetical protein
MLLQAASAASDSKRSRGSCPRTGGGAAPTRRLLRSGGYRSSSLSPSRRKRCSRGEEAGPHLRGEGGRQGRAPLPRRGGWRRAAWRGGEDTRGEEASPRGVKLETLEARVMVASKGGQRPPLLDSADVGSFSPQGERRRGIASPLLSGRRDSSYPLPYPADSREDDGSPLLLLSWRRRTWWTTPISCMCATASRMSRDQRWTMARGSCGCFFTRL